MAREVIDKDPVNKTVTIKHGIQTYTLHNVDPWLDTDEAFIALSYERLHGEYEGDDPEAKELVGRRNAKLRRKNAELHSLRCDTTLKLDIAERFRHDAFYFPYNVDFRGRA